MMLLDTENAIIKETLTSSAVKALKLIDTTFSEFSSTAGWLHYCPDSDTLRLSLRLPAWKAVRDRSDVMSAFKKHYNCCLMDEAEEGWDVSIQVPVSEVGEKESLFTGLRSAILAAPLEAAIQAAQQQSSSAASFKACTVDLSADGQEAFTVACQAEQVVFLLSTAFPDQTDIVLARVFLQEMFDVRKEGRMGDAPAVLFGPEPPRELAHLKRTVTDTDKSELNYLSIVLFPRHFDRDEVRTLLPTLRDFLHYHLKCCKAYLHGRMRAKTADFLKILNRAKPENFWKWVKVGEYVIIE